ncbi:MAG: DNA-binding protein WhiA [Bacteroidota bacterium]
MKDFSTSARAELARVWPGEACCAKAELAGILRAGGSLHLLGQNQLALSVRTEHADVARKIVQLLRAATGQPAEVLVEEGGPLRRQRSYHVQLAPGPKVKRLLNELGILNGDGEISRQIPAPLVRKHCCQASFLRGAYLIRGSVCDPRGPSYHLEIVAVNEEFGLGLCYLLNLARLKAHLVERKGRHVVYLKDGDDIAGLLSLIGAQNARLELEEVRVVKEVRGGVNRLVNAETANLGKSVAAAVEQVHLIETLRDRGVLADLPDSLRELALARLANPEATLSELGASLAKPASKSAVNHRLRRLRQYAEELR